jgi:hypothetical protein
MRAILYSLITIPQVLVVVYCFMYKSMLLICWCSPFSAPHSANAASNPLHKIISKIINFTVLSKKNKCTGGGTGG